MTRPPRPSPKKKRPRRSSESSLTFIKWKDRNICVGDCALFQSPQHTPLPFVGRIRRLFSGKDNKTKLCVNWFYRPEDVKLIKGTPLEAASNEIFYSFHEDEIHLKSLIDPCEVAFFGKGGQVPSKVSTFVCRRVYDFKKRCLWWLDDKKYKNEQKEELDNLLAKTIAETHVAVQSRSRSPKSSNGPTSKELEPAGSNSVQNNSDSLPSQPKGNKRKRGDQSSESNKRNRYPKTDGEDSGHYRSESIVKLEISKITDEGGLVDSEGVERLIKSMQSEKPKREINLTSRIPLMDVLTATQNDGCLAQFMEKGLTVLDEWLHEVHEGNDSLSPEETDKFLFALLIALEKLPVNLHALQTCNIGKSVNHLRRHKNLEIQKKARSIVNMWKKCVEAEMKVNDVKYGSSNVDSWPSKSGFPEVSQRQNRHMDASTEVSMKNSLSLPSTNNAVHCSSGKASNLNGGNDLISENVSRTVTSTLEERKESLIGQTCVVPPTCDGGTSSGVGSISDKNVVGTKEEYKNESIEKCFGGSLVHEEPTDLRQDSRQKSSGLKGYTFEANETVKWIPKTEVSSASVTAGLGKTVMLDFDLNEDLYVDDGNQGVHASSVPSENTDLHAYGPLEIPIPSMTGSFPASVTIASTPISPFVPPETPLNITGQIGWKGSAATNAFRPAEPRQVLEIPLNTLEIHPDGPPSKHDHTLLAFDFNVSNEILSKDIASQRSTQNTHSELKLLNYDDMGSREMLGFASAQAPQPVRSVAALDLGLNLVGEGTENRQSSTSTVSRLGVPHLPDRSAASGTFSIGEVNVLRNQFPCPGFPFSSSFPIHSASFSGVSTTYMDSSAGGGLRFPAAPSQQVGHAGVVSTNLSDASANSETETNKKLGRQSLELNAGPGGTDREGRDERFPSA